MPIEKVRRHPEICPLGNKTSAQGDGMDEAVLRQIC